MANISPIFKKGHKVDPENYRPISLTSVPSKIMESIIRDQIVKRFDETSFVSVHQHGFTGGRSTLTNLLETLESWTRLLDEGYGLDVAYLDFRKAFDRVSHNKLLERMKCCGFGGKVYAWIKDFLSARKMRVLVNGKFSSWYEVLSGIPQGSVIGPLLFLIFINELPDWVQCSIKMFADDIKLWTRIAKLDDSKDLQDDIDRLMEWSKKWLLDFNIVKCKIMHVGHNLDTRYEMKEGETMTRLDNIEEEKDMGVHITCNLKPSVQCAKAVQKAQSVFGMVRLCFKTIRMTLPALQNLRPTSHGILCPSLVTVFEKGYRVS